MHEGALADLLLLFVQIEFLDGLFFESDVDAGVGNRADYGFYEDLPTKRLRSRIGHLLQPHLAAIQVLQIQ